MSRQPPKPLVELAKAYGVLSSYIDQAGREQRASSESLTAALRSMGAPLEHPDEAGDALREHRLNRSQQIAPPVIVAWNGRMPLVELRLPYRDARRRLICHIEFESDAQGRGETLDATLLPEAREVTVEGERFVVRRLFVRCMLPIGCHQITLHIGSSETNMTVLSAPRRFYRSPQDHQRRELGIFAPWYALHSARSWGVGDLGDLDAFAKWAASEGCTIVGTLPMLALFLDEPFDPSPYAPVSRLFWNELIIDLTRVLDQNSWTNVFGSDAASFAAELEQVRNAPLVDYKRSASLKRRALYKLAMSAFETSSPVRESIEQLLQDNPELDSYAQFRAVTERLGTTWQHWPQRLRNGSICRSDFDENVRRYHLYVQWLVCTQLNDFSQRMHAHGQQLYLDMPLGVHGGGYDVWRNQHLFALTASVGSPPDTFFPHGQNWGFPPMNPLTMRQDRHRYFTDIIRNQLRYANVLRIDHVMALHRLFWIPQGMEADDGVYVKYPADELYAILSIETHRHHARIVGENLGTVPPEVNRRLAHHGALGMYVGIFELAPDNNPPLKLPRQRELACLDTHDTATFAAFWDGKDIDQRIKLNLLAEHHAATERRKHEKIRKAVSPFLALQHQHQQQHQRQRSGLQLSARAACEAMLRLLARSSAPILLVNVEDLWLETQPQNVPGTSNGYPNWRRKLARSIEQLCADAEDLIQLRPLAELRNSYATKRRIAATRNAPPVRKPGCMTRRTDR